MRFTVETPETRRTNLYIRDTLIYGFYFNDDEIYIYKNEQEEDGGFMQCIHTLDAGWKRKSQKIKNLLELNTDLTAKQSERCKNWIIDEYFEYLAEKAEDEKHRRGDVHAY